MSTDSILMLLTVLSYSFIHSFIHSRVVLLVSGVSIGRLYTLEKHAGVCLHYPSCTAGSGPNAKAKSQLLIFLILIQTLIFIYHHRKHLERKSLNINRVQTGCKVILLIRKFNRSTNEGGQKVSALKAKPADSLYCFTLKTSVSFSEYVKFS